MQQDWLFALPQADCETQERLLAEWMAADPTAAAITDEEAELFVAAGYFARFAEPAMFYQLCQVFGVRAPHQSEKARRRTTIMLMRRWKDAWVRAKLIWFLPNCGFGRFPDPAEQAARWTEELFREAYEAQVNIIWLVRVRRFLGKDGNLEEWLQSLGDDAVWQYRFWLDVGRLSLRRICYPQAEVPPLIHETAAAVQTDLAEELREKSRRSGALRQDVRRLQQDRKQLKQQARQAEREARELLGQARGEVTAARKALAQLRAEQERELEQQARTFEAQLTGLREQFAAQQAGFIRTLRAVTARFSANVLQGQTITVPGVDQEIGGLLVESLGGRLVPEGGQVTLAAPAGVGALERQLRGLALQRVLIKCDGLYRRKGARSGIAISGFQVHAGEELLWQQTGVVCCGPLAGSLMAEYGAIALALSWLLGASPVRGAQVEVWSDCKTLLRRLHAGRLARRKPGCVTLDQTVRQLIRSLQRLGCEVRLRWVPRDEVHEVDRLCDLGYREATWYHRPFGSRPGAPLKRFLDLLRTRLAT